MKNSLISLFSLISFVVVFSACNDDIDLNGNFRETPVIYGIIDQADSVHLLKITRAYIGPGNSLEYALIPDSSYFPYVDAKIYEIIAGGDTARTWTLIDTTVFNKEEDGIFYAPEQKLYGFYTNSMDNSDNPTGQPLLPNATYKLDVQINNGDLRVTAETQIVDGVYSSDGTITKRFGYAENAAATGLYKSTGLTVYPGSARLIEALLIPRYEEFNAGTSQGFDSFIWGLGEREITVPGTQTFTMNGEAFYQLMKASCDASSNTVDKRNLISISIKVVGGSDELYNYMSVNQPSSSLAQSKPTYTNLNVTEGHEVIGLFSSRQTYEYEIPFIAANQFVRCIDKNSTFELCQGPITGTLGFCSQHVGDLTENYSCQ